MEASTDTRVVTCPACGATQTVVCVRDGCDLLWFTLSAEATCQWYQSVCSPQLGIPRACHSRSVVITRIVCGGHVYHAARRGGRVVLVRRTAAGGVAVTALQGALVAPVL